MSEQQEKRMVSDTAYEVKQSIRIGGKEILLAEDMNAEDGYFYMVATYREHGIIAEYSNAVTSDDYLEAVQEFAGRITAEAEIVRTEQSKIAVPYTPVITEDQCHPHSYAQNLVGKVVAIRADALNPEYRRGEIQLVWVMSGNGARENPRGSAVYCRHLNDGAHIRFERRDVLGIVKDESLPQWAKEKLEQFLEEEKAPPQSKEFAGRYEITERIEVGQKVFALGHNESAVQPYGTWQGRKDTKNSFDLGHYFSTKEAAKTDLQDRAAKEQQCMERPKHREKER